MSWQSHAACRGQDPELFFPTSGESRKEKQAKAICKGCPVGQACLNFVLKHEEPTARHGIYAGLAGHERKSLFGVA